MHILTCISSTSPQSAQAASVTSNRSSQAPWHIAEGRDAKQISLHERTRYKEDDSCHIAHGIKLTTPRAKDSKQGQPHRTEEIPKLEVHNELAADRVQLEL